MRTTTATATTATASLSHSARRARRAEMAAAVQAGETRSAVAARFGVSYDTVQQACSAAGVPIPRHSPAPSPEVPQSAAEPAMRPTTYGIIAALFDTEATYEQIGQRFGVSKQRIGQVYQRCLEAGIPVPARVWGGSRGAAAPAEVAG